MLVATISEKGAVIPDGTTIFVTADGVISVDQAQLIPIPGTEGDLYYFHAGAVHFLHIGSAGKVLTSDGTDPGWQETKIPMAEAGVTFATRHTIDLDPGTGIVITPTDDAIGDAGHYLIALDPSFLANLSSRVYGTSTADKRLSLYSGSETPDPPPANWYTVGFDDSAWLAAVDAHVDAGYSDRIFTDSAGIWPTVLPHFTGIVTGTPVQEQALFRGHFTIGSDPVYCKLFVWAVNVADVYINGTHIGSSNPVHGSTDPVTTFTIDPSILVVGDNLIAMRGILGPIPDGSNIDQTWVDAAIDATFSGSGLPVCAEGSLLYRHGGAWVCLGIGPAFSVLQSNGADPVYGDVPLQWELAGVLQAVRGKANFIAGSNVALTVADNAGADRVDITVASNPLPAAQVGSSQSSHVAISIGAGASSNTAAIAFSPAFSAAPNVLVSSSDGRLIASAESVTSTGFTARLTANVPLAPGTSITATLYWSVGAAAPTGRHKVLWLAQYR